MPTTKVDYSTVFKKDVVYTPTKEECEQLKKEVTDLLFTYNFKTKKARGIDTAYGKRGIFWASKGWLIEAFKKHPNYNGNYQIIIPTTMNRYLDVNGVNEFFSWINDKRFEEEVPDNGDSRCIWRILNKIHSYMMENKTNLLDGSLAEELNDIICGTSIVKARFHVGQKLSKVVGKLCRALGLDKVSDIQTDEWTTIDGQVYSRTKDCGWNYHFSRFCDSINPITVNSTAVLSVNPLDFYTMSFGDSWSSCHTIDKTGLRHTNNHSYSGGYCGGTQSYALDNSTMIFYYLPESYDGSAKPETYDKVKRCVFYIGEDKLIQSRVYPDGRDGGEDNSLTKDIREIVQKIISDIFNVPNLWQYKGGIEECCGLTREPEASLHYRDYRNYSDCGICFLKRIDGYINREVITIGSTSVCIECGHPYGNSEDLLCGTCRCNVYRDHECVNCHQLFLESEGTTLSDGRFVCDNCSYTCDDCHDVAVRSEMRNDAFGRVICPNCVAYMYVSIGENGELVARSNSVVFTHEGTAWPIGNTNYRVCPDCGTRHNRSAFVHMCPTCRRTA